MLFLSVPFLWLTASLGFIAPTLSMQQKSSTKEPPQYTLSICCMFKNEAPYLKEWIEYHRLVGVEHFFLYNHESTDNSLEVLKPYLDQEIVEVKDWATSADDTDWTVTQTRAFNHCIKKRGHRTKWLAVIDTDEFIIPVDKPDLLSYLAQFDDQPSIAAIKVNWQLYGTSWLSEIPKDKLLIESFTLKAPWDYATPEGPHNKRVKSIVRPHAVQSYEIHFGHYKPGFTVFPEPNGEKKIDQAVQIDHIRINHYWTRSQNFFYEVKMGRRADFQSKGTKDILKKLEELNQVEDLIMMRFAPSLRNILFTETI